jgi:hypothetical protein
VGTGRAHRLGAARRGVTGKRHGVSVRVLAHGSSVCVSRRGGGCPGEDGRDDGVVPRASWPGGVQTSR